MTRATRYIRQHDPHNMAGNLTTYRSYLHGEPGEQPSAYLSVEHHPESTMQSVVYSARHPEPVGVAMGGESLYEDDDYIIDPWHKSGLIDNPNAHNPDYDGPDDAPIRPARENEQLQLFSHTPARPSKVSVLISKNDMGSKISAMNLLGMADLDARQTTGHPLQTSDDLSEHSMRIVRHLGGVGAIPESDVPDRTTNHMSFGSSHSMLGVLPTLSAQLRDDAEDVTHNAHRAKRHIAKMMRPGREKPKAETEKHTQLKLPGFE